MNKAYSEALIAYEKDEIPIASLLYHEDKILSICHNKTRELKNPLMHSESMVISEALNIYSDSILRESVLITTLEPCLMCSSIIILTKIKEVHFGAKAPKTGAIISLYNIFNDSRLNHSPSYSYGYMESEISLLLSDFFKAKRKNKFIEDPQY